MIRIGRFNISPIPCMRDYCERLAESLRPKLPANYGETPAPKKRQPAVWTDTTDLERRAVEAVKRVTIPNHWSFDW